MQNATFSGNQIQVAAQYPVDNGQNMAAFPNQPPAGMYPPNGQMQYPMSMRGHPPGQGQMENQPVYQNTYQNEQLPQPPQQQQQQQQQFQQQQQMPVYDQPVSSVQQNQPPQSIPANQGTGR